MLGPELRAWIGDAAIQTPRMNSRLRERVRILRPAQIDAEDVVAGAAIAVAASGGPQPAPSLVYAAFAAGAVPVAAQIDAYGELVDDEDGERGLVFPAGDSLTLGIMAPTPIETVIRGPVTDCWWGMSSASMRARSASARRWAASTGMAGRMTANSSPP